MITPHAVVYQARTYIGTPWRHQGRSRTGLDCGGLVFCVWLDLGEELDDAPSGYKRLPKSYDFVQHFRNSFREINLRDLSPGDVALFRIADVAYPMHAGIIASLDGHLSVIEARSDRGRKVQETRMTDDYHGRITHVFRDRSFA